MQRRLILMRHAKSSWTSDAPTDHARPLSSRGRRDAARIAQVLEERGWAPEAVWSSDSERTRETWEVMEEALRDPPEAEFTHTLYCASLDEIWQEAHDWPPGIETMLVLGHNPGWEHAVSTLCGETTGMTTANAALLEGAGDDWVQALDGDWKLVEVLRPRELFGD